MGCINGKQLLNEEDLNYIARNTAMDKAAVEVRRENITIHMYNITFLSFRNNIKTS